MTDDAGNAAGEARGGRPRAARPLLGAVPVARARLRHAGGDERYDDRLPDPSPEGLARRESVHRSALRDLEGMRRDGLGVEDRTALDMLESLARRDLAIVEHRLDRLWAVSHMQGSYLCGPGLLLGQLGALQRAETPERVERYVARLSAVPRYLEAIEEVMREGVDAGQVGPAVVVDRSIGLVERQLEAGAKASPAMTEGPLTITQGVQTPAGCQVGP